MKFSGQSLFFRLTGSTGPSWTKCVKEVEVAGGGELELAERAPVEGDDVGEPEREIRQVVG